MLGDVLEHLRCPHCGDVLSVVNRAVVCDSGHSFDVAKHGYVNLLSTPRSPGGDSPAMVAARAEFLGRGHFAPIAGAVSEVAVRVAGGAPAGCAVDVGAGTGYYLARVLESLPGRAGIALDASKAAARRAARAHERIGAVVCDAWRQLPLRTRTAALVLNVFAPRNAGELHRVLRPEGRLVVVGPSANHLQTLVSALDLVTVDDQKEARLADKLGSAFRLEERTSLEFTMSLNHDEIEALVGMGPSARHSDREQLRARIARFPEPVDVPASVSVSVYQPGT